ncbi:PREDICTED: tumor necrosis factor receptor superfamily member 9 isoform X3 [Propithecus coquereli]|uniref:tumor necrosis factor receptor superfamily member 9 isoform X3 n=1 Tax=Propithecus coquereli TaxID=379532 RepID=UPI00063F0F8F|nr:PREDICTED: tumor necrosis factor receptor superfamily member 9 isoform X3 [Propithecus coquereli]
MQDFIMGNRYYNMVATVLLVMNFERTRSTQDSCSNCLAGTFCGKNKTCIPCPPNSFSSIGGQRTCNICRQCKGVFRIKKPCSSISNAECDCISGFHCLGAGCTMCEQDCKQGQELTKEGCKDCCFGTFNDQKHGICRPWTNCSLDGKSVRVNGTKESDVVCGPILTDFSPGTASATMPAPGREPAFMKPVQTAQEEDACSCRFPEEEEGGGEL